MKSIVCLTILMCSLPAIAEEAKEETLVDKAARRFRIETYEQFRTQREIYDARRAIGDRLWKAWAEAGQPESHLASVETWYEAARGLAEVDAFPPLPELPAAELLTDEQVEEEDLQVMTSAEDQSDIETSGDAMTDDTARTPETLTGPDQAEAAEAKPAE